MDELNTIQIALRNKLEKDLNKWFFYNDSDNNLCFYRKDMGIDKKSVYSGDFTEEDFENDVNSVVRHIKYINKKSPLIDNSNSSRIEIMRKRKWARRFNIKTR